MDFLKFYLFERLEFCGDNDYCRMSDNLAYAQWRASPFNNDDRENWVTETIGRTVFGSKCEYVLGSSKNQIPRFKTTLRISRNLDLY